MGDLAPQQLPVVRPLQAQSQARHRIPCTKQKSYLFHELVLTLFARSYTVNRFVWVSAKFGTCTVESVNGTLVEDKMR
jgi:endo-1,4-beta-D-glucanase Y